MSDDQAIRGALAPLVTPFESTTEIANDLFAEHALRALRMGCAGLVPFGTTGEAQSIGMRERIMGLESLAASGVPPKAMIPGTGLTSLSDTVELCRHATGLGCHGVMVLPPFYYKNISETGIHDYYARLIETTRDPRLRIYLYHIPQVAGIGVPVGVARALREEFPEQIVGLKDSSGDAASLAAFCDIEGLTVYPGSEALLIHGLERGAAGAITAVANLHPGPIGDIVKLWDAGQQEAARTAHEAVRRFRLAVQETPMIPALKRMLAEATGDERWERLRPPLLPLDIAAVGALADRLENEFGFRLAA